MDDEQLDYSRIKHRVGAHLLDIIFCGLFIWITNAFSGGNKSVVLFLDVFQGMTFYFYTLYSHAKFGQTFGKRIMGLKVVNINGQPIGLAQSFRRNIPMFFESLPYIITTVIAITQIPTDQFHELFIQPKIYRQVESGLRPNWYGTVQLIFCVFIFMDLMTMFITKKRQSIHDLIGSTIVVYHPKKAE